MSCGLELSSEVFPMLRQIDGYREAILRARYCGSFDRARSYTVGDRLHGFSGLTVSDCSTAQ